MNPVLGLKNSRKEVLRMYANGIPREDGAKRFPLWPTPSDIQSYTIPLIKKGYCDAILILGSTHTLRDLAAKKSKNVTIADINSLMMISSSTLLHYADPNKETWVRCDWLKLPFQKHSFDVVMGDLMWWLCNTEDQAKLRDQIADILRPGGLFISRFYIRDANREKEDPFKIFREYIERAEHESTFERKAKIIYAAFLHLTDIFSDKSTMRMDSAKVAAFVESVSDTFSKEMAENLKKRAKGWKLWMHRTYQTREQVLNCLQNRFTIQSTHYSDDYEFAPSMPIMVFKKNDA